VFVAERSLTLLVKRKPSKSGRTRSAELGIAQHLHIPIQGYCGVYINLLAMINNTDCVFPFGKDMKRVLFHSTWFSGEAYCQQSVRSDLGHGTSTLVS
jgi:hypothetical protein